MSKAMSKAAESSALASHKGGPRRVPIRKWMEEARRYSEEYFRAFIENSPDAIVILDSDGNLRYTSPSIERVFGLELEELIGRSSFDFFHPDDMPSVAEAFAQLLQNPGSTLQIEVRVQHKDGSWRAFQAVGNSLIHNPAVKGIVVNFRDITEYKRIEKELRESEEKLKRYLEGTPDAICVTDLKGTILYVNGAAERLMGYSREEFVGKNFLKLGLLAPAHTSKPTEWLDAGGTEKPFRAHEFELIRKDGSRVFTEVSTLSVSPEGEVDKTEIIGIVRDITERKQMEEALRNSEEYFRSLTENISDVIVVIGSDGSIHYKSSSLDRMVGEGRKDKDIFEFVHPDDMADAAETFTHLMQNPGTTMHKEIRGQHRDGSWRNFEVVAKNLLDNPSVGGIVVTWRDITERKRGEEERQRLNAVLAEKNKELEQIIYATSHDLRSPLVNIQGFSKELNYSLRELVSILQNEDISPAVREKLSPIIESDIADALTYIQASMLKMDSLLTGLLQLSRLGRAALNFEQLDMNQMLSEIVKGNEYRIKEAKVTVEVGDLPPCTGDGVQINQVFSNLVDNALKYLDLSRPGIIKISGRAEESQVIYCVEDNGIGIPEKERTQVFEIFHQIDPGTSSGEGLGLSVVRKILSRHGGRAWVESEPGVGSKFFVSLPAIK